MSSSSDPHEWYRREELARDRVRKSMERPYRPGINVIYIAAAVIAALVLLLLFSAYGSLNIGTRILHR